MVPFGFKGMRACASIRFVLWFFFNPVIPASHNHLQRIFLVVISYYMCTLLHCWMTNAICCCLTNGEICIFINRDNILFNRSICICVRGKKIDAWCRILCISFTLLPHLNAYHSGSGAMLRQKTLARISKENTTHDSHIQIHFHMPLKWFDLIWFGDIWQWYILIFFFNGIKMCDV